jgi:hypothetical protein
VVIPDDEGTPIEYWHCPMRFVTRSVGDFIERLDYIDQFPHTAPAFDERSERWRNMERYYYAALAEFRSRAKRD